MKHRLLAALATATCLAIPVHLGAAPAPATAKAMYTSALDQEHAIRADAHTPTLAEFHKVIAAYQAVVRKHPASGYCDDALWQAGNLAMLAFDRFGNDADRATASHLFAMLVKEYPTSKFVAGAKAAIASPALATPALTPPAPVASAPLTPTPVTPAVAPAMPAPQPASAVKASAPAPAAAVPATGALTALKDVHRTALPDGVRVTVELESEVAYHQEEITNPRRLFFDLKGVKSPSNLQDVTLKFDGDIIKEVRLGRHPQNTTRLVMDLDGVSSYTVYPLYNPYRLVIDLQRTAAGHDAPAHANESAPRPVASLTPPPPAAAKPFTMPALTVETKAPAAGVTVTDMRTPAQPPPPPLPRIVEAKAQPPAADSMPGASKAASAIPTATPVAPAANSNGKLSLSRQLGLGVSRIVIDAGHGGHDPGARGNGINEADLTLDVAQRLQKLLEKEPGFEVVMTRSTDEFIPLQERTEIANREGADLFLSIHANASRNPQAHGIETYFLNFATNPEAEAVAARENATSGQPMHNLPDIVKTIALNNKINESRDFAATVQKSMVKKLGTKNHSLRDLGVKQAPFVVLIGASMPSVLAEISFVTNKQDGALLKTQPYRQQIAQALFEAVQNYQQNLKRSNGLNAKKATDQQ
jgi:N-acetylmuramoyl-L-alanine amidase